MNSASDINSTIKKVFLNPNDLLCDTTSIAIHNLFGLHVALKEKGQDETTTISQIFKQSEEGKNLFLNLVQYNSKRVNFLVNKSNKEWADNIINRFLHHFLQNNFNTESIAKVMDESKPPHIVGTCQVSNQIAIFVAASKKHLLILSSPNTQIVNSDLI